MPGIGASKLGGVFKKVFNYLATDDALFLTPEGGGDDVKFIHGLRSGDVDGTKQSPRVPMEMIAITCEPLCMGGRYTYNANSWTVARDNHHKAATQSTSYSYLLTRHAR